MGGKRRGRGKRTDASGSSNVPEVESVVEEGLQTAARTAHQNVGVQPLHQAQTQQQHIGAVEEIAQAVQREPEQAESPQASDSTFQHPLQPGSAAEENKGKKRAPKRGPQKKGDADAPPPAQKLPEITMAPKETAGRKPIKRPGTGTKGRKIQLYANFFEIKFKEIQVHHYDIDIEGDPKDRAFKRDLITTMMSTNPAIFNHHIYHAYDGNKNLYSAGALNLPNGQHSFSILLKNRKRPTEVKIQHVAGDGGIINLAALRDFIDKNTSSLSPEILNVLDIVLQQTPSTRYYGIGRYFFTSPEESRTAWGPGLQQWVGYYSSARPSWKYMFAQIDTSIRIFHKEQTLLDFICETIGVNPQQLTANHFDDRALYALNAKLDALNIVVTHLPYARTFRAIKLSQQSCTNLKFRLEQEGQPPRVVSVAQYFRETYPDEQLRFPHLPCVQVKPAELNRHFPIEVCRVKKGQQYTKMSEKQKSDLIRASAVPANVRRVKINDIVRQRAFDQDPFAKQFGLTIDPSMKKLKGRVLKAPTIQYEGENTVVPANGFWKQTGKYYQPGKITAMMIVTFGTLPNQDVESFFQMLQKVGREKGITIPDPAIAVECRDPRQIGELMAANKKDIPNLNFVLVILADYDSRRNTDMYNALKKAGDITHGIATQAVLGKNIREPRHQTVENICLKINAKVGGTNNVINQAINLENVQFLTLLTPKHVIVFGADVTHPSPQNMQHPSIAAVVASYDLKWAKYAAVIGVQARKEEIIVNLQEHVYKLLMNFYTRNNQMKPEKIIFYRDGVGEGQFDQVLTREMAYIQRACQQLEAGYQPNITLIVVQKRHHTRLFPVNRQDESGKAGNIPPGTTVDTDITHPIEFDFYLNSHQGIQGTCKPAHYHVLWDDNNFTADDLQEMTFQLCHLYARCNRSVSIPAPAYYAHLVAFRARAYLDTMRAEGHLPENPAQVEAALRHINASCQPHEQLAPGMFFV